MVPTSLSHLMPRKRRGDEARVTVHMSRVKIEGCEGKIKEMITMKFISCCDWVMVAIVVIIVIAVKNENILQ